MDGFLRITKALSLLGLAGVAGLAGFWRYPLFHLGFLSFISYLSFLRFFGKAEMPRENVPILLAAVVPVFLGWVLVNVTPFLSFLGFLGYLGYVLDKKRV